MAKKILTPKQSLLKGYMKVPVSRANIMLFKEKLRILLSRNNPTESEEFNKILVSQFLNENYYTSQGSMVNTYERTDLAIYSRDAEGTERPVVLFEFKGPGRPDMISKGDFRQKAMYELVLYYLREEIKNGNHDIRHLVVTDCNQFFIFEKREFYENFARNMKLVDEVITADNGNGDRTQYIYDNYIAPVVEQVENKLTCTYVDLRDFKQDVEADNSSISKKLIAAYKLLSPIHLMRLPFASDHNTLNSRFYQELLYIMGLQEVTEKKKKVIKRLDEGERQHYSLIEQACSKLEDRDDITDEKQCFDVAIGLVLIWINRILFLKLLESQLVAFNNSPDFKFLNIRKINDYDALDDLFSKVLAKPYSERDRQAKKFFTNVPYLNSSLFELSPLEQKYFTVSGLRLGQVNLYSKTIVADGNGRRLTGRINELEYLFRFLDAFDFGETAREDTMIADQPRTIIDASVLGLIFEKINGYKDGSIFTPGYITQHICSHTIRQAVVEKFNQAHPDWHCSDIDGVRQHINTFSREERTAANDIVNSLRICDIAVGSGHFLVSALNEIIALKSELGILQDHSDKPKPVDSYHVSIENDELVMRDEDGDTFFYDPTSPSSQRVQETMFEEKKTIIENCLFGVDLNPKSVEICRLRLWIELLKSAYYHDSPDGRMLRTLPNIDINIQCGDSLASRWPVSVGRQVKRGEGIAKDIKEYKRLVREYVNCHAKSLKKDIRAQIAVIKRKLNPPIQQGLFTTQLNERQRREQKVFGNALEWMMEFPEVLADDGTFLGFDAIIGNPPYINLQGMADEAFVYAHMRQLDGNNNRVPTYSTLVPRVDIYALFVERALSLLHKDGFLSFIIPNKWQKVAYGKPLRHLFLEQDLTDMTDFGDTQVFDDATTYTCIISMRKRPSRKQLRVANIKDIHEDTLDADIEEKAEEFYLDDFTDGIWFTSSLENHRKVVNILQRNDQFTTLGDFIHQQRYYGIKVGLSSAFLISQSVRDRLVAESPSSNEIIRPYLSGSGLVAFKKPEVSDYIIFTPKGFTCKGMGVADGEQKPSASTAWQWFSETYPAVAGWLLPFKTRGERRTDKGDYWWELRACDYYDKFAEPKILYQKFQTKPCFIFDQKGYLTNDAIWFISVSDRKLLSLLNSSTGWWLISEFCPRIRGGYQLIWDNLSQIPIPQQLPESLDTLASDIESSLTGGEEKQLEDLKKRMNMEVTLLYQCG